jgi:DNA-binding MarR family transcriptional regulator
MAQPRTVGPVEDSLGYVLKQASVALRSEMDAVLRPLGLSVTQYSCLELLGQRVDLSSAELARGTFVTRQSMHTLLRDLQERGLVTRAAVAPEGRALPARLTEDGRAALEAASRAVAAVEERMIAPLDAATRRIVLDALRSAVAALEGDASHSAVEP